MPQVKRDAVHRYFVFDESNTTSKCQICRKRIKGKHTSNLKSHLAVKHTTEYNIVLDINKQNPKIKQNPIIKQNSKGNTAVIEEIKKLCTQLVTVHGRPLDMIDDDAFQQLINLAAHSDADVKQINTTDVTDMVHEQAENIKQKIWTEIKNRLISLKLDLATFVDRKFIGFNIHYIKNGQTVVRNIAVLEMNKCQNNTFLKESLEEVLTEFKISINQIYCVCFDNGSNMIKTKKLIRGKYFIEGEDRAVERSGEENNLKDEDSEDEFSDLEWIENKEPLYDIKTEKIEEVSKRKEDNESEENEEEERSVRDRSSENELFYSNDCNVENFLPYTDFKIQGMLCAAHFLQLAIKDAINNDLQVQITINFARTIVNILRKPNNIKKLQAAKLKKPINDSPTSWTSTYNMLQRLITFQDFCDAISELTSLIPCHFWTNVTTVVECLEPANTVTIELQRQNLTIGDFYITWLNCKNLIEAINHSFGKTLHNAMQAQETKLLENYVVLEALYLDRRLNLILNDQQCEKAKSLLKETYQKLQKIKNTEADDISNVEANQASNALSTPSTNRGLPALEEMLARAERSRGSFRQLNSFDTCLNELVAGPRISLNENIIRHWNSTPAISSEMATVANTVLAVPATQVSVKRLISSLKFVLHPLRINSNQNFLSDLLLVRENKDLLD